MLDSNLERSYGWAIEAFRNEFGTAFVEIIHERRGRGLTVRIGQQEYKLFSAPTDGSEMFSLNDTRGRMTILQSYIDDARSHFS